MMSFKQTSGHKPDAIHLEAPVFRRILWLAIDEDRFDILRNSLIKDRCTRHSKRPKGEVGARVLRDYVSLYSEYSTLP